MQTSPEVTVGLRIVELIALLLPAVAILSQMIVRTLFDHEDEPLTQWTQYGFVMLGLSILLMIVVATNTLNNLASRIGAEWLSQHLSVLYSATWILALALLILIGRVFLLGSPGEDSSDSGDDPPPGIE